MQSSVTPHSSLTKGCQAPGIHRVAEAQGAVSTPSKSGVFPIGTPQGRGVRERGTKGAVEIAMTRLGGVGMGSQRKGSPPTYHPRLLSPS